MSIKVEDFEKGSLPIKRNGSNKEHPIYKYLSNNSDKAFTSKELAKALSIKANTTRSKLSKMRKARIIRRKVIGKNVYFTINPKR